MDPENMRNAAGYEHNDLMKAVFYLQSSEFTESLLVHISGKEFNFKLMITKTRPDGFYLTSRLATLRLLNPPSP